MPAKSIDYSDSPDSIMSVEMRIAAPLAEWSRKPNAGKEDACCRPSSPLQIPVSLHEAALLERDAICATALEVPSSKKTRIPVPAFDHPGRMEVDLDGWNLQAMVTMVDRLDHATGHTIEDELDLCEILENEVLNETKPSGFSPPPSILPILGLSRHTLPTIAEPPTSMDNPLT